MVSSKHPVGQTEHQGLLKKSDKIITTKPKMINPMPTMRKEKNVKGSK